MAQTRKAVQAAADEGEGRPRTLTFGQGEDAVTVEVPRKWKRFKFMRAMARGDVAGCLDSIWPPTKGKDGEGTGYEYNGEAVQRSKLRVDARKWMASKMAPKKYGDKLAVGGADDLPPVKVDGFRLVPLK